MSSAGILRRCSDIFPEWEESRLKKTVEVLETSTVCGFYANRYAEPKARE